MLRSNQPVKKAPKSLTFTYTDPKALRRYVTEQGYIIAREKTGLSQKQQRRLSKAIKQARHLALLPFTQTV
jgi:small subunit ribosomal protein S18